MPPLMHRPQYLLGKGWDSRFRVFAWTLSKKHALFPAFKPSVPVWLYILLSLSMPDLYSSRFYQLAFLEFILPILDSKGLGKIGALDKPFIIRGRMYCYPCKNITFAEFVSEQRIQWQFVRMRIQGLYKHKNGSPFQSNFKRFYISLIASSDAALLWYLYLP